MEKKTVYFDSAATTALRPEVQKTMMEVIEGPFGNPSSTHQYGRKSRSIVESARKYIAQTLNCSSGEIIFTSGGTEADNTALLVPVRDLGVKRIITSKIEHHAVLHTAQAISKKYGVALEYVPLDDRGAVKLDELENMLQQSDAKTLVSLMHGNNEIGNLLDLKRTAEICKSYGALFHSDTVQTVGHFDIDLQQIPIDFIAASAHKFHGPKGVGFLFMRSGVKADPFVSGGAQERNMRGGTENVLGIAGLHKALECSIQNMETERAYILDLKNYLKDQLTRHIENVSFNGLSGEGDKSLYSVLSVSFNQAPNDAMFLFNLDIHGVAASGGSACSSGSNKGSHVIAEILPGMECPVVRFSLCKDNTRADIDYLIKVLEEILEPA